LALTLSAVNLPVSKSMSSDSGQCPISLGNSSELSEPNDSITSEVACEKIVSLWKLVPKAIPKGKIGKPVEFGRKWIVNAYHGGYVLVMAPENPKIADPHCVFESLSLHKTVFDDMPSTYN